jgi:hypothetical protein
MIAAVFPIASWIASWTASWTASWMMHDEPPVLRSRSSAPLGLLSAVAVLSLLGPACQGERAYYARDPSLGSGGGSGGSGGSGGGGGGDGGEPIDGSVEHPICTADNQCGSSLFCSAGACVSTNLAGNGDLETGTPTGWAPFAGGTLVVSSTASGGVAHGGQYSNSVTNRTQYYQGPSYAVPTGIGQYTISAWGLQQDDPSIAGVLQLEVVCATTTSYVAVQAAGSFGVTMNQNTWTMFGATVDTSKGVMMPADCDPNATPPGLVKVAVVYLNHVMNPTPVALPNLYMDDLVVQVPDGHNLVGNPNFEAGLPDGWSVNGGASPLAVSATVAHGGTHSLGQSGRTTTSTGPRYVLPIGTARYNLTFWVEHNGTAPHDLTLQAAYTCIGSAQVLPPPIHTASAVAGGTWTELSGTLTLPPANATPGCVLAQAAVFVTQEPGTCGTGSGQVECPDLFVDDVSITVAP